MNVSSRTNRLLVIGKGHNEPRPNQKQKAPPKTASQLILYVKEHLAQHGPTPEVYMRRTVTATNRQRHYRLRSLLQEKGFVEVKKQGKLLMWFPTSTTRFCTLASVMPALEPHFCDSKTDIGMLQIDCPLCGLTDEVWETREQGKEWFWNNHQLGVCHQ